MAENVQTFIAKWKRVKLTERQSCQEHFLDLCDLLGEMKPAAADPDGEWFCFEAGVTKSTGGHGWADVWRKDCFGWEYKRKRKDLREAYEQLCRYREALQNPPLLVVCDTDRFEVHTNFPGTVKKVYAFDLDGLADPTNLNVLRHAFTAPNDLHPNVTQEDLTKEVTRQFARIAHGLKKRRVPPDRAAHFLMKLMFVLFAEDANLLPRNTVEDLLVKSKFDETEAARKFGSLFRAMAVGGDYGNDTVRHFNGALYDGDDGVALTRQELLDLRTAAKSDWSYVEPSIFGTLFEQMLDDRNERAALGAHYTGRADIETLVRPVVMQPLEREWDAVKAAAEALWPKAEKAKAGSPARKKFQKLLDDFLYRLETVTVLDPACGSGNFLYVTLALLLDLEKKVLTYRAQKGLPPELPGVRPKQLLGIEKNKWAQELAQVVLWIGFLQWCRLNGFEIEDVPVLSKLTTIENRDAILDLSDPENPKEAHWPDAEFVVGNPPFLGDKKMRGELGDAYVDAVRKVFDGRIPGQSDLCCYWFEKARAKIQANRLKRVGLIATQGIRGGANRTSLDRILNSGGIFFAFGDRNWILDGATVHVSMIGFDDGSDTDYLLDGEKVSKIHNDLKSGDRASVTNASVLVANSRLCFLGVMKAGPFDIDEFAAIQWLTEPNPHGKPNSDVLRPRLTARDILQKAEVGWVIDFGCDSDQEEMAHYSSPWQHVVSVVKPLRDANRDAHLKKYWWQFGRPRPELRKLTAHLNRFIVTPEVSKHRVFTWLDSVFLADHQTRAFTDGSDYFFGVVHSRIHELWARAKGTQLREVESGFRYTPSTCFETFPFPNPTDAVRNAIASKAQRLEELRNRELTPPEWTKTETLEFPGAADGPWKRYVVNPNAKGIGTVKYPRTVPANKAAADKLKKRTLTNLYNENPAWLRNAHRALDEAVFAAYGWPADLTDDQLLAKLLALNLERAAAEKA